MTKNEKLLALLMAEREQIENISQSDDEYYFSFRGKAFSIAKHEGNYSLFAYPKWSLPIPKLVAAMERGSEEPDAAFARISGPSATSEISQFFEWLRAKNIGLDQLFSDLGIS